MKDAPGPADAADRSVADRLLRVLGAFTPARSALTLSDIARRAGLPLATAHRLIARLVAWGALERDADGVYHIGLRLWEVAALAPRGVGLRETALPFLEDLYEATHENVHLAVRDGLETIYLERLSGHSAVGVLSRVGARWPLHATGVGLVLLAHSDPQVQQLACTGPLRAYTPHTVTDPAVLRRMLAGIRRTGIAVSDRQITEDAISVAAPVYGPGNGVVASVSVVVHAQDARTGALVPAVRVAAGISRALGWLPAAATRRVLPADGSGIAAGAGGPPA